MATRSLEEAPNRAALKYWMGQDGAGFEKAPNLLNNESLESINAANTALIGIVKVSAADAIEFASSAVANTLNLSNGAGAATINLAMTSVLGGIFKVMGAVTGAGLTDAIELLLGNAAATGIKSFKLLTGTPVTSGNNKAIIGGGVTTALTFNAVVTSYQAVNYQGTEGGANNAITCNLVDSQGTNVTLAAGLRLTLKLAHSLQAGANTLALNGGATKAILSHRNTGSNIAVAYVSGGIIELIYDGTQWQDLSQ